jgi:hypothetical protein
LRNFEHPEGEDPGAWSPCGEVGSDGELVRRPLNRAAGTMLRLLAWLAVLGSVVTAVAIVMPTLTTASDGVPVDLILLGACGSAVAGALFYVVRGIRRGHRWARVAGMSCGALALVGFPMGTVAGCHVLWRLMFHWEAAGSAREA